MERNLLTNTVRESGDHGPVNSWDRVPYITTVRTGAPSVGTAHLKRAVAKGKDGKAALRRNV